MPAKFAAFWSYARADDAHEDGRVSALRERLAGEVAAQIGEPFEIFQDQKDIKWGELWAERLDGAVDATTFLIPIITPTFFKREFCRKELERFLEREKQLRRKDLVLPIYYMKCRQMEDKAHRAKDFLAKAIHAHQHVDWREFRFEPLTGASVLRRLADMASRIVEVIFELQGDAASSSPALAPTTGPKTVVVDQMDRGDYSTIEAAIDAAKPGMRILVRPGLYQERIVIDKPLEIVGDGDRQDIVVESTGGSIVVFKTRRGRIANLTLRQLGRLTPNGVDITQGQVELEDCDISSSGLACIYVHSDADPRVRRNRIHARSGTGVMVFKNGRGTFEDNDICGNLLSGITVTEGGDPIVRKNRIYGNGSKPIWVHSGGHGTFEQNDLRDNNRGGYDALVAKMDREGNRG